MQDMFVKSVDGVSVCLRGENSSAPVSKVRLPALVEPKTSAGTIEGENNLASTLEYELVCPLLGVGGPHTFPVIHIIL